MGKSIYIVRIIIGVRQERLDSAQTTSETVARIKSLAIKTNECQNK